jgi:spermidine synthase
VIPRLVIDTAEVPGGGQLRLVRRGADYSIMLGANELMNSRLSGSEEALAEIACRKIEAAARARLLIGGLGMGFTLRAALAALGERDAEIVVAELVPAVVRWARGPMAELHRGSLDDPRVRIAEGDVAELIPEGEWNAILLDVDNGPNALTQEKNARLYDAAGLARARTALRKGGVLAIWSAAPDRSFSGRLRDVPFEVEEVVARARGGGSGARHHLWFAKRP